MSQKMALFSSKNNGYEIFAEPQITRAGSRFETQKRYQKYRGNF
jgi:hypothetical protein